MLVFIPSMQSVFVDDEFGKRIRHAACEMTCANPTLKLTIGDETPVPVEMYKFQQCIIFLK